MNSSMRFDITLKGKCILCAEDNDVNQLVLEHTLAEQPIPVVIVENGKLAVEGWRELSPRLIIMDISMPVIDGLETIRLIRAQEQVTGDRVPIVALTAHALEGDDKRMLGAGADHYLTKPINPNVLLQKIDFILSGPSTRLFV